MGYLKERTGFEILGVNPPGTCPECAVAHSPEMPHDRNSLMYQYRFYDRNGRWPTWKDAMAHCSDLIREAWIEMLRQKGVGIE